MADSPELRVSDEDRERAAREIREHFAAGRLTDEELSQRLDDIYRARTKQELRVLASDLPILPITARAELAERRTQLQRRLLQQAGGSLGFFVLCSGIWLASGANGQFWPMWVALVALVPLLRNGWRLYGPAPELDRVEEELTQREQRRSRERRERRARRRDQR
jgi:hypothetical protein